MELLFGIFAIGYFLNLLGLEPTIKTIINVVIVIVIVLLLVGMPFVHVR